VAFKPSEDAMGQTYLRVVITTALGLGPLTPAGAEVVHIPTVRVAPSVHVITQAPAGSGGKTGSLPGTHEITKVGFTFQKIETSSTNGNNAAGDSWNASTGNSSGKNNGNSDSSTPSSRFHATSKWDHCKAC
jgi:hypothetical protein